MGDLVAWITAAAGVVAAITGLALWWSERDRNKVLRRQLHTLDDQLEEARAARAQHKAVDLRILDVAPTGGGGDYVDFNLQLANYGTGQCRCKVSAAVGTNDVECQPATLDLVANSGPTLVRVLVPRPDLGELMKECNDETTLYGETLVVRGVDGKDPVEATWREPVYDPATHRERHEIQQRYWRMGRGEETEGDMRAAYLAERIKRLEDQEDDPPRYEWS